MRVSKALGEKPSGAAGIGKIKDVGTIWAGSYDMSQN